MWAEFTRAPHVLALNLHILQSRNNNQHQESIVNSQSTVNGHNGKKGKHASQKPL